MKNQIIKFEKGGLSYLSPKWSSPPQQTKEEVESSKNDDGLSDIFNKLTGLPSDISALQDTMQNIVTDFNGNVSKSSAAYRYIVGKIAAATANKNLADQAIGFVKANDSMREYAITNNGGIFVYKNTDDGKRRLALISVKDFNPHKDLPAYVSDLINERSNNPQFANNNELLTTIGDSIGRSVVFKKIMDIAQNVKYSNDEVVGKEITNGIKKIENDSGHGEWAQTLQTSTKVVQSDKDPNVERAQLFIYNSLTDKEKILLGLIGKEQKLSIGDIITNVIKTQSQTITKKDYDFVKLDSNNSGSGSGSGNGDVKGTTATTQAYLLQHDIGERMTGIIKVGSTVLSTSNNGWRSRDILDKDKNVISGGSIKNILFNSQISSAIDKRSIYFGGQKMSNADLDYIAYKPNGYTAMYLPYKTDAQNNITIDFAKWKVVEDAETEIKNRGIKKSDIAAVKEVYNRHKASDMIGYAYANADIKSDENPNGVTQVQKNKGAESLYKFVFFEGIAPQDALSDYGSGAITNSKMATIHKLKRNINNADADRVKQEYLSTILNGADKDDKKLPQYLKNATKAVESGWPSVESDMVESLVYAPVHHDYTTTGVATENIVTKKQLPSDEETNALFTETPELVTNFKP